VKDEPRIIHCLCACPPASYQPPGARTEKVARLKDAVSHGEYRVDAGKVAQALLKNNSINQMITRMIHHKMHFGPITAGKKVGVDQPGAGIQSIIIF
jgi:hypothetical protein